MNILQCAEHVVINSFPHYLEGIAEQWFYNLEEPINSIEHLKQLLYKRFRPSALNIELLDFRQSMTETVDDYIHRVLKLCADSNLADLSLMTKAMKGLRPEIAKIVMPQDPVSVEDLRLRSVRAETTLRLTNNTEDVQMTINALTKHFDEKFNMMQQDNAAMVASIQQPQQYQRPRPAYRGNSRMMTRPQPNHRFQTNNQMENNEGCHRCGKCCGSPSTCYARFKICNQCKRLGHIYDACWYKGQGTQPRPFRR